MVMLPWPRPIFKNFSGVVSGLSLLAGMQNFKSVAIDILVLLVFNGQKFQMSRDFGHTLFYPHLTFRSWRPSVDVVWTMKRSNWSKDDVKRRISTLLFKMHYVGASLV